MDYTSDQTLNEKIINNFHIKNREILSIEQAIKISHENLKNLG